MPGNSDEQKNLLPGLKPVLELLKCDPDRVDAVYVRDVYKRQPEGSAGWARETAPKTDAPEERPP